MYDSIIVSFITGSWIQDLRAFALFKGFGMFVAHI